MKIVLFIISFLVFTTNNASGQVRQWRPRLHIDFGISTLNPYWGYPYDDCDQYYSPRSFYEGYGYRPYRSLYRNSFRYHSGQRFQDRYYRNFLSERLFPPQRSFRVREVQFRRPSAFRQRNNGGYMYRSRFQGESYY